MNTRRTLLAAFGWGAVALAAWVAILPDFIEGVASWSWERAEGQVMRADLGSPPNPTSWRQGSWRSASLAYYFKAPDASGIARVHRASRYNAASSAALRGHAFFPLVETALVHEIARQSGRVTVHYPRGQPERALLRAGIAFDSAALALCALVPTLLCANALRRPRGEEEDRQQRELWMLCAGFLPFLMPFVALVAAYLFGVVPPGWLVLVLGALPVLAWYSAAHTYRSFMVVFWTSLVILPGTALVWYVDDKVLESPKYVAPRAALEQGLRVEDDVVRRWALYSLIKDATWHAADTGPLRTLWSSRDASVRRSVVTLACRSHPGSHDCHALLAAGLEDPDGGVVSATLHTLRDVKPPPQELLAQLIALLQRPEARQDQLVIQIARYGKGARSAVPAFLDLIARRDQLANWLIRHLRDIGASPAEALPVLIAALATDNDWTRAEAAEALGGYGRAAAPAVRALEARLADAHRPTRERAAQALKRIAGKEA